MRIIATIELKKYILNTSFFSIIIYKLNYWQKFYLVILLKVDKNSKIHLYYTMLTFELIVDFRI